MMMMKETRYWGEPFHHVRLHARPLGASRVTLPPSCAAFEAHLPTPVLGRTFHPVRVYPTPLGARRVALPPHCDAIEVHLPTQVLRRTLSPRKSPPQTLECEESDATTSLRLTRVTMSNHPPHTTPQTLSVSPFHPVKDHWYFQWLVHGAQRALVLRELFSTVSL
ncbi:hypothetical protein E2C01_031642 [Portunus trituberculatus]|uniref:Uncharacterized protein n=1 Tax=Portunus trituberculatus TaxID=210409 RepID=A0A5B7EYN4_PORTR|nr:hypothetical protein [Portunus trituberculatus]